ncbi:MAG: hypothetical protein OEW15_09010 [Nitrospirota bacterium]|nr:hypothetical protein [Nitrospirota bacterium]
MDSQKLKKIMKQIEDSLAAVSFAEEGQQETAATLFRRERRLLVAVREGHVDPKTLKYGLNTAVRIGSQVDILYVTAEGGGHTRIDKDLEEFDRELSAAAIPHRLVRKSGCLKQQIIDYTNKEHEVLFVVVESPRSLDADCSGKDTALTELWKKLRCPLVVVSEAQ